MPPLVLLLHNIDVPILGWRYLWLLKSRWLFWIIGVWWGMILLSCQCWPVTTLSCHSCLMLLLLPVFWCYLKNPLLSPQTILHTLGWLIPRGRVTMLVLSERVQLRRSLRFPQHLLLRLYPVFLFVVVSAGNLLGSLGSGFCYLVVFCCSGCCMRLFSTGKTLLRRKNIYVNP